MKEKTTGLVAEFKEFISRGNVVDLAVGVILGSAFNGIVSSLTDIIMSLIGNFMDTDKFGELSINISGNVITYGTFLQAIFNFLIMALVLFLIVKAMNRLRRKKAEAPATPPAPPLPTREELLLTEIRDLLQERQEQGK